MKRPSPNARRAGAASTGWRLLIDVGNTHVHLGLADARAVRFQGEIPTGSVLRAEAAGALRRFVGRRRLLGAMACSVVPRATPILQRLVRRLWGLPLDLLHAATVRGVGVHYPQPHTIGPDRLANAVAVAQRCGCPAVAVDFGTAVTFDVVDRHRRYVGGIIAPGLALMTHYLHEKTALLPAIELRPINSVIGRSTEEAMLIGAVHGYRGLVRELIARLRLRLRAPRLPVIATGGCARLLARGLPELSGVDLHLTLEGLRLEWETWGSRAGGL